MKIVYTDSIRTNRHFMANNRKKTSESSSFQT